MVATLQWSSKQETLRPIFPFFLAVFLQAGFWWDIYVLYLEMGLLVNCLGYLGLVWFGYKGGYPPLCTQILLNKQFWYKGICPGTIPFSTHYPRTRIPPICFSLFSFAPAQLIYLITNLLFTLSHLLFSLLLPQPRPPLCPPLCACNAKAAAAVGEVLAARLAVDGLAREAIYADASKKVEKKGFRNRTKVWALLNALRSRGVNLRIDDGDQTPPR